MPATLNFDRPIHSQSDVSFYSPSGGVAWWAPPANRPSTFPALRRREPEGKAAFVSVLVFTFILLLSPQNWIPALGPLRIAFLAAGAGTMFLLWDRCKREGPRRSPHREVVWAIALAVWAFVTLPLSYWPGGSASMLSDAFLKALVVFWLLPNVVTTPQRLRVVALSLMLCTIPLDGTAVKNFVTGKFIAGGSADFARIVGYQNALGTNPNDMALMLNLILPLSIAVTLSTTRASVRLFCLLVIAFTVLSVILTFSRAGFLGLATVAVVYFIKIVRRPRPHRMWAFSLLLLATLSLPLLPSNYISRVASITDIEADPTGSAQARWSSTVAAVKYVREHPIVGAGIGMDVLALNEVRGPRWSQVHNVYLQYAVDLGLPGLILFLLLLYGAFKAARASRRLAASVPALQSQFLLSEGLEVSLIVFAIAGLFHPVGYHFYFYYIAGLSLAARSATEAAIRNANVADDSDRETEEVE